MAERVASLMGIPVDLAEEAIEDEEVSYSDDFLELVRNATEPPPQPEGTPTFLDARNAYLKTLRDGSEDKKIADALL